MQFNWWTFLLQTVNFAVLVWLLHRFLYRPVLRVIAARRGEIDKQYEQAKAAQSEAQAKLASIEAERAHIASERDAALKAAAAQADEAGVARRARAERDAAALLESARKTIAAERGAALAEARAVAVDLGCEIARRLLAEIPIKLRAEAWLERVEEYLAALPQAEREGLTHQIENGASLEVVTASELPVDAADSWRKRLQHALGDGIAVAFATDPALIAGVELHFPTAILRFSGQSTLAAMRSELDPHADAR